MTTFGKILTVLIFLVSIGLGAELSYLYITRVRWDVVSKKWQVRAEASEAAEKALKDENAKFAATDKVVNNALLQLGGGQQGDPTQKLLDGAKTERATRDQLIKDLQRENDELRKTLQTEKKKNTDFFAMIEAYIVEGKQNLIDKTELKKKLDAEVTKNTVLQLEKQQAIQLKVEAEVKLIALKERNIQVEHEAQEMAKENARLVKEKNSGGSAVTGATTISLSAANPPPFAIEGKVLNSGGDGRLLEISVGSDAGLQVGHTLEWFRISPKPQYLGMIRLITVEPNKAVGQVIGSKQTQMPQRGDIVSSKISGN